MTTMDNRIVSVEYPYPAHGIRKFAIGLGLALVGWGRNRSSHGRAMSYRQQRERQEHAHTEALRFGGIR